MIVDYIKGDITEATPSYIAHGVNCQNRMGSGVAKALYTKWPKVKEDYHRFCLTYDDSYQLLGKVSLAHVGGGKGILNCFTQRYYGYDKKLYVSYPAVKAVFKAIEKMELGELAIPQIGCGLAGGDWKVVEEIINECTLNTKVYVYIK